MRIRKIPNLLINKEDLEISQFGDGEKFSVKRAEVSAKIDASKLGYDVVRLAPGKRSRPFHAHYVIEEAFFMLAGHGTLRHGDKSHPVREGDFICAPPDPNQPHQIINTSNEELTYIAMSTNESIDICSYPDSDKFGVWHTQSKDSSDSRNFMSFRVKQAVSTMRMASSINSPNENSFTLPAD
jgi:uncharacterized cupin superfamily protein